MKRQKGTRLGSVGLYGYSMGGAVALQSLPDLPEIKAAVTLAAFAELRGVMQHQSASQFHGVLRPLLPWLRHRVEQKANFDPFTISPLTAVTSTQTPIFSFMGS